MSVSERKCKACGRKVFGRTGPCVCGVHTPEPDRYQEPPQTPPGAQQHMCPNCAHRWPSMSTEDKCVVCGAVSTGVPLYCVPLPDAPEPPYRPVEMKDKPYLCKNCGGTVFVGKNAPKHVCAWPVRSAPSCAVCGQIDSDAHPCACDHGIPAPAHKTPFHLADLDFLAAMCDNYRKGIKDGRTANGWKELAWDEEQRTEYISKTLRHLHSYTQTGNPEHLAAVACNVNILWHYARKEKKND